MNQPKTIRRFAKYRQYTKLRDAASKYWENTRDPSALPLLLLAHAHLGAYRQAVSLWKRMPDYINTFDTDALADLGGALIVMLRLEEAATYLEQALSQNPAHGLGLARLGHCRMLQGDLEEALRLFEQAAGIETGDILILNNLAAVYLMQSQLKPAQQVMNSALEALSGLKYPDVVMDHYRYTLDLLQLNIWVVSEAFGAAEHWLGEQVSSAAPEWAGQYSRLLAENDHHDLAADILKEYLGKYPDSSALCLQLVELAEMQGQLLQAVHLLKRVLQQDDTNISLWTKLADISRNHWGQQARNAAEKAMVLAESLGQEDSDSAIPNAVQQANARNALALVESSERNYEKAENLFKEILSDLEYFAPALQGLGLLYMEQGRITEAVALYEELRQIDPIKGHLALMNARKFPEDDQTLEALEKAAEMTSLEGRLRSGILFQLASAWEKRGVYDRAMDFASRANHKAGRLLSYDPKAHRNYCARIRCVFSKPLYNQRKDCALDTTLPVYVMGMPRSGTTLVEQILSGHSRIFGAGELDIIPGRVQGLNRWERHVGSGRSYPDCIDDLSPYLTEGIAKGILKELRELAADAKPDALHVVDKLPHNFQNIGFIKFLFPKARIISVRRDPRDIALSNYFIDYMARHGGMGFAYDLTHIGLQLADHNLLMHHWNQLFPDGILEIKYEDVVDDLEGSARRMLEYIGVPWEPGVLRFNKLDRPVKTASVWQVRQPIYKTSKARWKRYEKHLAPLIKGTNAKIEGDPIQDRIILPEPAWLQDGVACYEKSDLAGAERCFRRMLHHNPEHGACNYMLGLVSCSIGNIPAGIPFLEKALRKCPWKKEWRDNLLRAYQEVGDEEKINALMRKPTAPGKSGRDRLQTEIITGFTTKTAFPTFS